MTTTEHRNLSQEKARLLARMLAEKGIGRSAEKPDPIPTGQPSVASFAQQRIWFLSKLEPDSTAFNLVVGISFQQLPQRRIHERP